MQWLVFHHQINKMQKFFLRKSLVCRCGISPQETFSARDCHLLGWLLWRQSVTRATCCSGAAESGGPQEPWPSLRRGAITGKTSKTSVSPWLCKIEHSTAISFVGCFDVSNATMYILLQKRIKETTCLMFAVVFHHQISLVGCFDVSQSRVQLVVQGQRNRVGHRGHGLPEKGRHNG